MPLCGRAGATPDTTTTRHHSKLLARARPSPHRLDVLPSCEALLKLVARAKGGAVVVNGLLVLCCVFGSRWAGRAATQPAGQQARRPESACSRLRPRASRTCGSHALTPPSTSLLRRAAARLLRGVPRLNAGGTTQDSFALVDALLADLPLLLSVRNSSPTRSSSGLTASPPHACAGPDAGVCGSRLRHRLRRDLCRAAAAGACLLVHLLCPAQLLTSRVRGAGTSCVLRHGHKPASRCGDASNAGAARGGCGGASLLQQCEVAPAAR